VSRGVALFALLAAVAVTFPAAAWSAKPVVTGFQDPQVFTGAEADLAFDRAHGAGARMIRIFLNWRSIAPGGLTKPDGFVAQNPADPWYRQDQWGVVDAQVRRAVARGLQPFFYILVAPDWAEGTGSGIEGTVNPDPNEMALFAQAAATRYGGTFDPGDGLGTLPRVRDWEVWNETNLARFFSPQFVGDNLVSPHLYRNMVNAVAGAIHGVNASNRVIAGALAPFGRTDQPAPLHFMRAMLCMTKDNKPGSNCPPPARFDIWSHHPYAPGGPNYDARKTDEVSIGDLPRMRRLLAAAANAGRIRSSGGVRISSVPLWVTEFGWDTNGPDPKGVPMGLHARWTAELLYRMWSYDVRVVIWFGLRDEPFDDYRFQTGFYFCGAPGLFDEGTCGSASLTGDSQKSRSFTAFRFPFVAFASNGRVGVWGDLPAETVGPVYIDRKTSRGWKRFTTITADGSGVFSKGWRSSWTSGYLRARVPSGETSIPFSLRRPPSLYTSPFGCGGGVPC
jgi:hypothetical protein